VKEWKKFEKEVFNILQRYYPDANIFYDVKRFGRFSLTYRQIDILITSIVAGNIVDIVVDTKYYKKKIDVKIVEEFIGMLDDLDCHKGILITNIGFTNAAMNRALNNPFDFGIDIISSKELNKNQGCGAIGYNDKHAVLIQPPIGWVVDCRVEPNAYVASAYSKIYNRDTAFQYQEFMYINIENKVNYPTVESLMKYQNERIQTESDIYFSSERWKTNGKELIIRTLYKENSSRVEYTAFIEFPDFFAYGVLITPIKKYRINLPKMIYTVENLMPMDIKEKTDM